MKSLWNEQVAKNYVHDPLQMRVYSSRLIGQDESLVLHGGGNTSVKALVTDIFDETFEVLYVKGSGWDLATIEAEGFAPVRLETLKKMAEFKSLSDTDMVLAQRAAMTDPQAPNPSVEAILHANIPYTFVDHTHADAVVAVTNTDNGEERIREIYGNRVLVIPYVMPGFELARYIYEKTRDTDWNTIDGMVLLHHGIFTFHDDAQASYEMMIELVSLAEDYLSQKGANQPVKETTESVPDIPLNTIAHLRKELSKSAGFPMIVQLNTGEMDRGFASRPDAGDIAVRGPLTPDHVIRTKRIPLVLTNDITENVTHYKEEYEAYFKRHSSSELTMVDPAPRWIVWPKIGTASAGKNLKAIRITNDIVRHTITAIQWCEALGGWKALPEKDICDIEYWELEQAKLKKNGGKSLQFEGKIALVTGAASGIGKACVEALLTEGAVVAALDINPDLKKVFSDSRILPVVCDVTDEDSIGHALRQTVLRFGGLDILISNAGVFTKSSGLDEMEPDIWEKSLALNLTSHQRLLKAAIPFLKHGIDPAVVYIGSKNVPAPGPGAGAYSVAKAGLTQLSRVAALELGQFGIRVNVIHPNMVFDTAIWTDEVLQERAAQYNMSVEEYKTNNLLKTEVTSWNVAELAVSMAGTAFAKSTGTQVSVDGGNERVV